MAARNKVLAIERTNFNAAGLNAGYQVINSAGLEHPCTIIRIINDSTSAIDISYDGTTDHDYLRPDETLQLPFQSNAQPSGYASLLAQGTRVYVSGVAGVGDIYLVGYYNPQD